MVVWFDDGHLRRVAGDITYARALDYRDLVGELTEVSDGVTATVDGAQPYRVRLLNRGGALAGSCSCPWGQEGHFCKHCLAVGLVMLDRARSAAPPRSAPAQPAPPQVDLRAYLTSVDPAELVRLLLELAANDRALHRRLVLRATAGQPDSAKLCELVDSLHRQGDLDAEEWVSYAHQTNSVLHTLDMIAPDHPALGRTLYQRVLEHLTATRPHDDNNVGDEPEEDDDDYDDDLDDGRSSYPGNTSVELIRAAAARAVRGLTMTCRATPTNPDELAGWLVEVLLAAPDWLDLTIANFSEPLGADGLAAYWRQLAAAQESHGDGNAPHRHRITSLREDYLETVAQDVDALVAVYAEDLSDSGQYVRIAQALRTAGRIDEAIDWLHRGQPYAAGHRDLADLLAELYAATGRHTEVVETRWEIFQRRPSEHSYRMLTHAARSAGTVAETTERALTYLRDEARRGKRYPGSHTGDPLVTVLTVTEDPDQAWAAAREFGCSQECLFALARRSGDTHPADAIPIYEREIGDVLDRKGRAGYTTVAKLLARLKDLHHRAGSDFTPYLDQLKATHGRKYTLMRELAAVGL